MSILVFVEHHGSELQKGSLGVLTKAASLGDPDVAAVLAADVAAGLAARLDAGLNWDLVDITNDRVGKRPALQDSVLVDVGWKSTPRIALFRAGSFDASTRDTEQAQIVDVSVDYAEH